MFKMAQICDITGKKPMTGNNVSHAKNRTKRRFNVNLHKKRIWSPSQGKYIKLSVSAQGMRIIDKNGIDSVLADIASRKKLASQ